MRLGIPCHCRHSHTVISMTVKFGGCSPLPPAALLPLHFPTPPLSLPSTSTSTSLPPCPISPYPEGEGGCCNPPPPLRDDRQFPPPPQNRFCQRPIAPPNRFTTASTATSDLENVTQGQAFQITKCYPFVGAQHMQAFCQLFLGCSTCARCQLQRSVGHSASSFLVGWPNRGFEGSPSPSGWDCCHHGL